MAVYVVSDLHGCYDVFTEGLKKISFGDNDFLYVLGDAIDRGYYGIRILQHIMSSGNMDLIIGNHEFMMLNSVSLSGETECDGRDGVLWLNANGGLNTFWQYIKLSADERIALLGWLKTRHVIKTLELGDRSFCLTHSFYNPDHENKKYWV